MLLLTVLYGLKLLAQYPLYRGIRPGREGGGTQQQRLPDT